MAELNSLYELSKVISRLIFVKRASLIYDAIQISTSMKFHCYEVYKISFLQVISIENLIFLLFYKIYHSIDEFMVAQYSYGDKF